MEERFVDRETGEILTRKTVYLRSNEFVKVINPFSSGGRNAKFVKIKTSQKAKRRYWKLDVTEAGFLFKLIPYASPNTNILVGDGERGRRNEPLTVKDLFVIAGVSKPTGMKLLRNLLKKNAIGFLVSEGKRKAILINPDYALNGKKPSAELMQAFRSTSEVAEGLEDDLEDDDFR